MKQGRNSLGEATSTLRAWFGRFARYVAELVGAPWAFVLGVIVVALWVASGPFFAYSDTWQLVINTGTTIVTFLIVFLIQHTQNRDARVVQLKLDELIRALVSARTELVNMESLSDEELNALQKDFETVRDRAVRELERISARRLP